MRRLRRNGGLISLVFSVGLLGAGTLVSAGPMTGEVLLNTCSKRDSAEDSAICLGYTVGMREGLHLGISIPAVGWFGDILTDDQLSDVQYNMLSYCPPPNMTNFKYVEMFVNYLQRHPTWLQEPASSLFLLALQDNFPCREGPL